MNRHSIFSITKCLVKAWKWWGILLVAVFCILLGHFLNDGTDKSVEKAARNVGFSLQCYGFFLAIIGQRVLAKRYGMSTMPEIVITMIKKMTSDSKKTLNVVISPIQGVVEIHSPTILVSTESLDIEKRFQVLEFNMKMMRSDIDSGKTEVLGAIDREKKRHDVRISAIENLIEDVGESLKSDRSDQVSDGRMAVVIFLVGSAVTTYSQELVPLFRWII